MNKVTIFEAKVSVSVAKFDKYHREFQQNSHGSVVGKQQRPMAPRGDPVPQRKPVYEYMPVKKGRPYSEVVKGTKEIPMEGNKTVVADDRIAVYPDYCMMRVIIIELKNVLALKEIRRALDVGGIVSIRCRILED
ncbi:hypothetical protein Hanom_Chr16g01506231 [Helianthus anomalus]